MLPPPYLSDALMRVGEGQTHGGRDTHLRRCVCGGGGVVSPGGERDGAQRGPARQLSPFYRFLNVYRQF